MPVLLRAGSTPVAYVDGRERVVVKREVAALIYRCLAAYSLNVEPGVEEDVTTQLGRIEGVKVSVLRRDADEGYVVEAIKVCFAFKTGIRLAAEEAHKLYELQLPARGEGQEGEAGELEGERS